MTINSKMRKQLSSSLSFTRCMECRRGVAMRILSVRLSVCRTREL